MPIYEYVCRKCDHRFETIVSASSPAECPSCRSTELDKLFSVFGVGSSRPDAAPGPRGACSTCGDPRGPGACSSSS